MSAEPLTSVRDETSARSDASATEPLPLISQPAIEVMELPDSEVTKSAELGELFQALCAAQAALQNPSATGTNEDLGTRHLTLASVLSLARPVLLEYGLCILQMPSGRFLRTFVGHKSGQYIQCDIPLLLQVVDLTPMQALAAAVSFARRIVVTSVLGLTPSDVDGGDAGTPRAPGSLSVVHSRTQPSAAPQAQTGFSVRATIDAINAKTKVSELDDAQLRVKAAFTGRDLEETLEAIEVRRRTLSQVP